MHSPNGQVIENLHSPDTFHTHLGERASANVRHWDNDLTSFDVNLLLLPKDKYNVEHTSASPCNNFCT